MDILSFVVNGMKFGVPVNEIDRVIHVNVGEEKEDDILFFSFVGFSPVKRYISFEIKGVDKKIRFLTGSERSGMHNNVDIKKLKPSYWFPHFYIGVWKDYLIIDIYEFMSYEEKNK